MKRIVASLLLAAALFTFFSPALCDPAQVHISGNILPAPDEYMTALCGLLNEDDIAWRRLSAGNPYIIIINSTIYLELTPQEGETAAIALTAQGDGSARSGETSARTLRHAINACTRVSPALLDDTLLDLISSTSGAATLPGLDIALALSPGALEVRLTPGGTSVATAPPPAAAPGSVDSIDGLIALCAGLLPEGWTQTSYLSGAPDSPDLLLSIYAAQTDPNALWLCARDVLGHYWRHVRQSGLECGRLSLAMYSSDMTPLLSLGIGREDALSSAAIAPDAEVDELRAELTRLAEESDALVIEHYGP